MKVEISVYFYTKHEFSGNNQYWSMKCPSAFPGAVDDPFLWRRALPLTKSSWDKRTEGTKLEVVWALNVRRGKDRFQHLCLLANASSGIPEGKEWAVKCVVCGTLCQITGSNYTLSLSNCSEANLLKKSMQSLKPDSKWALRPTHLLAARFEGPYHLTKPQCFHLSDGSTVYQGRLLECVEHLSTVHFVCSTVSSNVYIRLRSFQGAACTCSPMEGRHPGQCLVQGSC